MSSWVGREAAPLNVLDAQRGCSIIRVINNPGIDARPNGSPELSLLSEDRIVQGQGQGTMNLSWPLPTSGKA